MQFMLLPSGWSCGNTNTVFRLQRGGWELVETFDQGDNPQFSLTQATLTAPNEDGYWVYAKEYDCFLGCN